MADAALEARARRVLAETMDPNDDGAIVVSWGKAVAAMLAFAGEAVAAEREACAEIAEAHDHAFSRSNGMLDEIAAAIRQRTVSEGGG